ncbi:lPXTG-motif cell wall anchor domain protein [Amedibacillus dolichus CAG:375]|uniref:LPXTG-motif cell wall anchor domain protein n=2 Tax=Amedibacillus dolichus TaxID=31971 RepID=R7G7Z4_9FIRM|nr:lPXTG-motif cell wall anchor domain protein [Amedibacillus dolichus CAG:375]
MGTVLFTVVGVGGILAVLYSFMKSNKKNKLNENK